MQIKFSPNGRGTPAGKLADAEIHFEPGEPLAGLRLLGFAIWQRRTGGGRTVTFPARIYSVMGERRSFNLLRPQDSAFDTPALIDQILQAYAEMERQVSPTATQPVTLHLPDPRD